MSTPQPITRVIELTPTGRAAVAVVLVAGPDAVRVVDECFQSASGRPLADVPAGRIVVGRWASASGEELIACRRTSDSVEIHCHGGTAPVRQVIDSLCERGCQQMEWQDWLSNSGGDPIGAAAQVALASAPTERTAAVLLDQLEGALAAAIRATLDAAMDGEQQAVMTMLEALVARRSLGLHLTAPWRVVLAGRPNVGKSSLMNALVGFQRAIVCDHPGTTRDVVTATTAIDGWPIQLADTAGMRMPHDELESAGIARANAAVFDADLILSIDDVAEHSGLDGPPSSRALRVLNKADLLSASQQELAAPNWDILTSAATGDGIGELIAAIGRALVPNPPAAGAAVPFTTAQIERLEAALSACNEGDAATVILILKTLCGAP
jgi:tRNA modification GTPase